MAEPLYTLYGCVILPRQDILAFHAPVNLGPLVPSGFEDETVMPFNACLGDGMYCTPSSE
jgi:hypothetical protein